MDGDKFDRITRSLAQHVSRRSLLRGLSAVLVGSAIAARPLVGKAARSGGPNPCNVYCAGESGSRRRPRIRTAGVVRCRRREARKLVAGLGCVDKTPFQRNRVRAKGAGQQELSRHRARAWALCEAEVELG